VHANLLLLYCRLQRYAVGLDQRAPPPLPRGPGFEYRYLTEFQSHEPEFDYLKSLEIEEKINKVRWVRSSNNTKHIIATNDKTIKLWKVSKHGKQMHLVCALCTCPC
jgi:serine/threonine-protein phosphatase 2A regulatory subunit B